MAAVGRMQPGAQLAYRRAPGTIELVLVRHGSADVAGSDLRIEGQTDAPLTEQGHRQAAAVAARLATTDVSRIFVTSLQRTAQTAAPLVAATGIEPVAIADLREYALGEYDGPVFDRQHAAGDPLVAHVLEVQRFDELPGAETAEAFTARVARGLARVIAETGPDRACVVVVHAVVIAEILRMVTGSEPFAFLGVENGSISVVIAGADGGFRLRSFNDTAHLVPAV